MDSEVLSLPLLVVCVSKRGAPVPSALPLELAKLLFPQLALATTPAAPAEVLRSTDGRVLAAARSRGRGPDVGFDERRAQRHCMAHSECQSDEFCESVYFMCSSCSRCAKGGGGVGGGGAIRG